MSANHEAVHEQIATVKSELLKLESAPSDEQTIREAIADLVGHKSRTFAEQVAARAGIVARHPRRAHEVLMPIEGDYGRLAYEIVMTLLAPQIEDLLSRAAIEKAGEAGGGIAPVKRREKIEKARRTLYDLELDAAAAAHEAGTPCRSDINACAWLGVPFQNAQAAGLI